MPEVFDSKPVKIIQPGVSSVKDYLTEIWQYRDYIIVFARQEFKLQYVQTRFNFLWVVLRPMLVVAIFTFVFDKLIHINGLNYPYPLFAISGLIIWNVFSFMVNTGNIVITNQQLVKKNYFPRLILILSKLLISMIEATTTFILLLLIMFIYSCPLHIWIIFSPLFIIMAAVAGTTISIWLNALTVNHRDLHQFVPTVIGFMIWLTPVFYPVTLIPSQYSFFLYLNPIAGIIQCFRWSVLGDPFPGFWVLPSFLFILLMVILGLKSFIKSEVDLPDNI